MSREPSRERPILFSAPMVRAILAGTKTQTRRVVKTQPWASCCIEEGMAGESPFVYSALGGDGPGHDVHESRTPCRCPYGEPCDRLWVKESTIKVEDHGWIGPVYVESDAGRLALEWGYGESDDPDHIPPHAIKRRPSIFMTRAMSRITLEITGVRVERLQEISEADARAEGAPPGHPSIDRVSREFGFADFPRSWYGQMWEQINGRGSWAANPWVWVLEFRKLERQG